MISMNTPEKKRSLCCWTICWDVLWMKYTLYLHWREQEVSDSLRLNTVSNGLPQEMIIRISGPSIDLFHVLTLLYKKCMWMFHLKCFIYWVLGNENGWRCEIKRCILFSLSYPSHKRRKLDFSEHINHKEKVSNWKTEKLFHTFLENV